MNTIGRVLGVVLVLFLIPSTAHADTPKADNWEKARFETSFVCVQKVGSLKGWRLNKAIKSWNSTGLVQMYYSPRCPVGSTVTVHGVPTLPDRNEVAVAGMGGPTSYLYKSGDTWVYSTAAVWLNHSALAGQPNFYKKCNGWQITTHELGHALGLDHIDDLRSIMSYDFDTMEGCHTLHPVDTQYLTELGY
jgi:hypothetical protein